MCARILVIDDDPINAELIGYLLRAFGHQAVQVLGGEEALQEARTNVPDLVLCDIQMPGVDGYEVLRRLRQDRRFDRTKIAGVTALAMVGDREKVLAAGFDGYLTKPITPETFVGEIEKFLPEGDRRADSQPPAAAPTQAAGGPSSRRAHDGASTSGYALVVDDVEANVQLMRHILTSLGMEVRAVRNAHDALSLARALRPALIISDIHMPVMDGIQLLEAAKADAVLKDVPFILISASRASQAEEQRALAAGAQMMLRRPLDPEALIEHLSRWIA